MKFYHGTTSENFDPTGENPETNAYDLCLALERSIAQEYAEEHQNDTRKGRVFAIEIGKVSLADEEEAEGFDGVEYVDQSPTAYKEHDTVRIYRAGNIKSSSPA